MKKLLVFGFILLSMNILFAESTDEVSTRGLKVIKETRDLKSVDEYANQKRWAIVIGINDYTDQYISDLVKARNDAKGISDMLKNEGQFDQVFTYTDDLPRDSEYYPSLSNIIAKFELLQNEVSPNDTLIFYFSGHGISDDFNKSYLLTADTNITFPYKTSLALYQIQDYISKMGVKRNIVILDACRNVVEKSKGMNVRTLMDEKNSQAEISAVVYATSPGNFSYEHDKEPYGVFSTYFIDGMRGKADLNGDILITFNELRDYVENGVKDWSLQKNKLQKPFTSIKGEFHGDLVMSVLPEKEREKYNPGKGKKPDWVKKIEQKQKMINDLYFDKKLDLDDKFWGRHFFNINIISGFSFINSNGKTTGVGTSRDYSSGSLVESTYNTTSINTKSGYTPNFGFSISYCYGINNFIGLGAGISGQFSLGGPIKWTTTTEYDDKTKNNEYDEGVDYFFNPVVYLSGGVATFNMMIGDLKSRKISFLLDFGVGWLFSAKIGIFIKGFVFKAGYNLSGNVFFQETSNGFHGIITFDIGYTINWAYKSIGK